MISHSLVDFVCYVSLVCMCASFHYNVKWAGWMFFACGLCFACLYFLT